MLLIKRTCVLAFGYTGAFLLRSRAAAVRHLVWLSTLSGLLGKIVYGSGQLSTVGRFPVRLTKDISGPLAWSFGRGTVLLPPTAESWSRRNSKQWSTRPRMSF